MTIFPKGVLCNQSSVRPIRRAQMNNLTLNKEKIYSPQARVQYHCSSRWHSSICRLHGTICLRLRQIHPLCSPLFPFLPFLSRCGAAEAVFQMCQVIIESLTSAALPTIFYEQIGVLLL